MGEGTSAGPTPPTGDGWLYLRSRGGVLTARLLPTWALFCGAVASGGFAGSRADWFRLAFFLLLVDGGWGTLWHALATTDWDQALRRRQEWRVAVPLPGLPYTQPGTPGERAVRWLGRLLHWERVVLRADCGEAVAAILGALPVTAVLAAYLGFEASLLTLGALAAMQLGVVRQWGRGTVARLWDAVVGVTWPWLAGHVAFAPPTLSSTALALAFTLAWGGMRFGRTAQVVAVVLLIFLHRPLGAGGLLLLLVPQFSLRVRAAHEKGPAWYFHHLRPWLLAAMAVAALALGWPR